MVAVNGKEENTKDTAPNTIIVRAARFAVTPLTEYPEAGHSFLNNPGTECFRALSSG
jgi:hypothetical protein